MYNLWGLSELCDLENKCLPFQFIIIACLSWDTPQFLFLKKKKKQQSCQIDNNYYL